MRIAPLTPSAMATGPVPDAAGALLHREALHELRERHAHALRARRAPVA